MIDKKYLGKIRAEMLSYSRMRRDMIKTAGDAQHLSKKAIFAFQRDDKKGGEECLSQAEKIILNLTNKYKKDTAIFEEGSYRAALEEFAEASIFFQFLSKKSLGKILKIEIDPDVFIGGLCDVPGELLRYAIKSATERKFDEVKKCHDSAEEIIGELVDMDLTGYNRQKFDQAKQALHKLEQVVYEVSMKN